MLENNFGTNFCLKIPTAKNQDGARPIYMCVTVNRPRDTNPTQICHPTHWKVQAGSEVKKKKASAVFKMRLIIIAEPLCHEG